MIMHDYPPTRNITNWVHRYMFKVMTMHDYLPIRNITNWVHRYMLMYRS
jgi:hypothetical protein